MSVVFTGNGRLFEIAGVPAQCLSHCLFYVLQRFDVRKVKGIWPIKSEVASCNLQVFKGPC